MKLLKILIFLLIFNSFLLAGIFLSNEEKVEETITKEYANVTNIVDGDTIDIQIGNITQRVRLLGINTPEKKERLYEESRNFTSQLQNQEIILIKLKEDKDQYGRLLRYVEYNSLFNKKILENGLATLYYYKEDIYYEEMKKAEENARIKKIGIWEKSKDICKDCIILTKLNNIDPGEYLTLKNNCSFSCNLTNWIIKDDTASHKTILNFSLKENEEINITYNTAIWNDDKDTFYLKDNKEYLVIFYRYS
jgi:endonuclease YncB( thermonuclease family)